MNQSKKLNESSNSMLEYITTPVRLDQSSINSSNKKMFQSKSNLNFGQFNDSKLSQFYSGMVDDNDSKITDGGKIICLADIHNKEVVIREEALSLLKKYKQNQIAFVGNCGKKGAGKSFWYDKILNLSEVEGDHYSKIQTNPGLYIWSIPFIKRNLRIFLIDFQNKRQGQALSAEDQKLLDLELILSQILVVLPEPDDQKLRGMDLAYNNLKSSMSRLSDNGDNTQKQSAYWPHSVYNLYRSTKPVSKQTDKLAYLFQDYSFSIIHNALNLKSSSLKDGLNNSSLIKGSHGSTILNEKYVKRTSLVFKDIYNKLKGKRYENVSYNGKTLPFILSESATYLNKGKPLKMQKMFNDVKKDLYQQKLKYGTFIYDVKYANLLKGGPRPLDNVIDQFRSTNENVQNQFKKDKYDDKIHDEYQKKLLGYGTQKQAEVLKYNKQQTTKFLDQKLPRFQSQKQPNEEVINFIHDLKKTNQQLDHDRVIPVKQRLKGISQCAVKYKYFHVVHTEAYYNQRKKEIDLQNKKKQLADLKSNRGNILLYNDGQGKQAEDLLNQHDRSLEKIDKTKSQLQVSKKFNNAAISDEELQKQLQNYKAQLESALRKNDKKMRDLQKAVQSQPKIVALRQKLDDKAALQMQIQGGLSVFNQRSQSMLNGRRSQIRKVKKEQIKKSAINKSMAK